MKVTARALGAQIRNVHFLKIGFIGQTEFIAIWYLVTNSGLSSNSYFLTYLTWSGSLIYEEARLVSSHQFSPVLVGIRL
jgi:hypothetical protein